MQEKLTRPDKIEPISPHPSGGVNLLLDASAVGRNIGDTALTHLEKNAQELDVYQGDIDFLQASIDERVELALESCEFEATPEVEAAIKGFYSDHLTLQAAIKAVVGRDYSCPLFDKILAVDSYEPWEVDLARSSRIFYEENDGQYRPQQAPNVNVYALRIARYVQENPDLLNGSEAERLKALRLCGMAVPAVYSESSIAVTTIGQEDVREVSGLADSIIEEAGTDRLFDLGGENVGKFYTGESSEYRIRNAQKTFWADTRYAGQLLFHGSSDIGGINLHGLMSRNEQLRRTGEMENSTALNWGGATMHSVVPHFSEFYGMGQHAVGDKGGTLAIPLIKVIDQAPYARDAKYAAVQLKNEDSMGKITSPTFDMPVGSIGAGRSDCAGERGFDRVFFASPDETGDVPPDDYVIGLIDKTKKPATYIVDRTDNHASREAALSGLGVGHGFPERVYIGSNTDENSRISYVEREAAASEVIKKLQQNYFEAYRRYGVIVPLRRGVFAQAFENVDYHDIKGRPQASIYNRFTPGSGKQR